MLVKRDVEFFDNWCLMSEFDRWIPGSGEDGRTDGEKACWLSDQSSAAPRSFSERLDHGDG